MTIGDRIKYAREAIGLTQQELAIKIGYKSKAAITKIESGERKLPQPKIVSCAKALNVSPLWLLGMEEGIIDQSTMEMHKVPLIGKIACGVPVLANQEQGEPQYFVGSQTIDFCLVAKGDSMIDAGIKDGDVVFCKQQETVENGEIAALLFLDGAEYAESTLKRFFYYPDQKRIILIPENPNFPPLTFVGEEMEKIKIIGKAVVVQSKIV